MKDKKAAFYMLLLREGHCEHLFFCHCPYVCCGDMGFQGDLRKSPVTGHLEPFYPAWKRNLFRYCVSMPIIILCLLVVFYIMLLIFQLQEWVNQVVIVDDAPSFFRFGPKVLMAVAISVMDELYKQLAVFLNNKGEGMGVAVIR